jgi:epsilon-lactone hydrolase
VVISPLTDFSGTAESRRTRRDVDPIIPAGGLEQLGAAYTQGKVALDDPLVAPLQGELTGLPPLLIHVGDSEVLLSDSTELAAKAERAGVTVTLEVWDRMPHVFHFFTPFLPEADEAIARIGAFLAPSGPAGQASPHVL